MKLRLSLHLLAAIFSALAAVDSASAAEYKWTGASNADFHDGANWSPVYADWKTIWWDDPNTNTLRRNTAVFSADVTTANKTLSLSFSDLSMGGLRVESGAVGYSIQPNTTGRGFGLIAATGSGAFLVDINENFAIGGNPDAGKSAFNKFKIYSAGELKVASGKVLDIYANVITDASKTGSGTTTGNITKTGDGTLSLHFTGAIGSYTKNIVVKEGAVMIGSAANLGVELKQLKFDTNVSDVSGLTAAQSAMGTAIENYAKSPSDASRQAADDTIAAFKTIQGSDSIGTLKIDGGKTVEFKGSPTADSRLVLEDFGFKTARVVVGDGSSLNFSNNQFVEDYEIYGGAVRVGAGNILSLEGNATGWINFWNNTDVRGVGAEGGAIYNQGTTSVSYATFVGNGASEGGAIKSSGVMLIDAAHFIGNAATLAGGAVYNSNAMQISNSIFLENNGDTQATGYGGGAIYNTGYLSIVDSDFVSNTSGSFGGAIANADGGTVVIGVTQGSTATMVGNTAAGASNGIDLWGADLVVDVAEDGSFNMADPLTGTVSDYKSVSVRSVGEGIWRLGGDSVLGGSDYFDVTFAVESGTLHLYRDGELLYDPISGTNVAASEGNIEITGANSTFSLLSGATLSAGGGNAITVEGGITLGDGATLAFDLSGAVDAGIDGDSLLTFNTPQLTLDGGLQIKLDTWSKGTFVLAEATGMGDFSGLSDSDLSITYGDSVNERQQGQLTITDGNKIIVTTSDDNNIRITWTGNTDSSWNASTSNWTNESTTAEVTEFMDGDFVVFDSRSSGAITVDQGGVSVEGIEVKDGGDYTYEGGKIDVAIMETGATGIKVWGDNTVATFHSELDIDATDGTAINSSNGGGIVVDAIVSVFGSISIDEMSFGDITMRDGSVFTGNTSCANDGVANLRLSMDGTTWNVTDDSSMTSLEVIDSSLIFVLSGSTPADYATVTAAQAALFNTEIFIVLDSLYNAGLGDSFTLFDIGDFDQTSQYTFNFDLASLDEGLRWNTDYFKSQGRIFVELDVVPEPTTATLSLLALAALSARRRRA